MNVQQEDPKGCGVACVASVLGMKYSTARDHALDSKCWRASYGMNGGMLQRLLDRLGKPVHTITMGRIPSYPFGGRTAIVKVTGRVPVTAGKHKGRDRLWMHWIVWRQGKVWDPGHGREFDTLAAYLRTVEKEGARGARAGRWHWL